MILRVLLPERVLINEKVTKVKAEAANGAFTLLPKHVDFVAALVPGILSFASEEEGERFMAIDQGVLVKCGDEVLLSTRNAVIGPGLEDLKRTVREQYELVDDRERHARSASARLEAGLVRRFMELEHSGS
ncbi:F0F1 ATP synthase subunit epsilon [Tautonia marina]|uniref:F0F1 ATP synthase subunit epsilon n=1 Tax=Tautonia marina TaxID=2653855 RepID=UPI00126070A2|nr:F0F1 ATP synthase subunit epsilon [Tautonia marina]